MSVRGGKDKELSLALEQELVRLATAVTAAGAAAGLPSPAGWAVSGAQLRVSVQKPAVRGEGLGICCLGEDFSEMKR